MGDINHAMEVVVSAHQALADFHRELAGLFQLIDELMANDGPARFSAINEADLMTSTGSVGRLAAHQDWVPGWFGRFYVDSDLVEQDENPGNCTSPGVEHLAGVWVVSKSRTVRGFEKPECWIVVADPGVKDRNGWKANDFARLVFNDTPEDQVAAGDWCSGKFRSNAKLSGQGRWTVKRLPLASLATEADIRNKVVEPLRTQWTRTFGGGGTHSSATGT